MANDQVAFQWKDYRCRDRHNSRTMTISSDEFLRRFLMHVMPPGFQRIRHFGLLANRHRQQNIELCRKLLGCGVTDLLPSKEQLQHITDALPGWRGQSLCPSCGVGVMVGIGTVAPCRWPTRPPPDTS
jgi:hypothetical protein